MGTELIDEVIPNLDRADEMTDLVERINDPRTAVSDEAKNKYRQEAYDVLVREGTVDPNEFDNPNSLDGEMITLGYDLIKAMATNDASNAFSGDSLDDIVDNQITEKALDRLSPIPDVIDKIPKDYDKLIRAYLGIKSLKEIAKKYEAREELSEEAQTKIIGSAARRAQVEFKNKFRDRGYSENVQNLIGKIAILAVQGGYFGKEKIREYALKGFNKEIEGIEDNYNELVDREGKSVYEGIRKGIKNLAKGNSNEYKLSLRLVHAAETDTLDRLRLAKRGA